MTRFTRLFSFAMLALVFISQSALAATLEEAKAAGQIGEKQDGYIGLVQSAVPADVAALVDSVNAQRRARYEQIAASNGIPVSEVAKLAFERALEATGTGHFVESAPGQWVRKP